eukprot:753945-Hanusia_phi.AAC.7
MQSSDSAGPGENSEVACGLPTVPQSLLAVDVFSLLDRAPQVKEEAKLTADREFETSVTLGSDEELKKNLFSIFDDPLFVRGLNGSIRLNETEAELCGHKMSRLSYMFHLQNEVAIKSVAQQLLLFLTP